MRAVIYARYSSELQSNVSIEDQVRVCRERALADGHQVVEVFSDCAISGSHLHNRPGMQDLLRTARSGQFELLLAESLDRLSRDQEDVAAIYKRLTHAGVTITTLAEGVINELHIGLKGTMNALYLKDLAEKTRRGQRGRVEAGKIPGGNSYGYRIVRHMREDGTISTGEREINEAEACTVRRIFEDYAAGIPPRRIAAKLNGDTVPGPRGGLWNASTINGSRQRRNGILNNELYCGRIIYNRQHFVKDPDTGKRLSRPNPESRWITTEVPHLRIVDDALWERVHAIKSRYSSWAGNKRQTKRRLLSGLVRCGSCGGAMTIVNRERYSCSAKRERGTCSNPVGIQATELEERVLSGLRTILVGQEALIEEFAQAFRDEIERLRRTRTNREEQLSKDLAKVERAIARCLAFITEGDGDPSSVAPALKDLEARKRDIQAQLDIGVRSKVVEIHPNVAELYRRKVNALQHLLTDESTRTEAMDIVRTLIERIEVRAGTKRGSCDVVLVGALAQMLEFACAERRHAVGGGLCRVSVVAGAGFEPATFRL